jgi:hypothetical protein
VANSKLAIIGKPRVRKALAVRGAGAWVSWGVGVFESLMYQISNTNVAAFLNR